MSSMALLSSHNTGSLPDRLFLDGSMGYIQRSSSYNQQHFTANTLGGENYSKQAYLGPEAALLPASRDLSLFQCRSHGRRFSEHLDVSYAAHCPETPSCDSIDDVTSSHSPLQRPFDGNIFQINMSNVSIVDGQGNSIAISPSHSPAIKSRLSSPNIADFNGQLSIGTTYVSVPNYSTIQGPIDDYSSQPQGTTASVNIDIGSTHVGDAIFDGGLAEDQVSLTARGRRCTMTRTRPVTDLFRSSDTGDTVNHLHSSGGGVLSFGSNMNPGIERAKASSLSDRRSSSVSSRPRQSIPPVPSVIALRLAGHKQESTETNGSVQRLQRLPTFRCTLCPKRFTRAYNLRSHLRAHTDERPFVCIKCGKAFARQHDRKRHESLHSGVKKFVCQGDLKTGMQWGCGKRFARVDALGRHFQSDAGRICIKPLLEEEIMKKNIAWQEQSMQRCQVAKPI